MLVSHVRFFLLITVFFCLHLWAEQGFGAEGNPPAPATIDTHQVSPFHKAVATLIDNGGFIFTTTGNKLVEHNRYTLFTPASILKIATASAAVAVLGPQYRFRTAFYQDQNNDLFIKGYGDPFLTSEEIAAIWNTLTKLGIRPFKRLYIDNSYFNLESSTTDGAKGSKNPYDALNASLSVNFNALPIKVTNDGVVSLEPQTPFIPLMSEYAVGLSQGKHRIAISKNKQDIAAYVGQLFVHLAPFNSPEPIRIEEKTVPPGFTAIYEHQSTKSLAEIISSLLLYSNNFIANQLFLSCGAVQYGPPATWKKGRDTLELFLSENIGIVKDQFVIEEGSGLSRKNKLTPEAMLRILENFKPYSNLLPRENSLSIKSGTLKGVYSYAGYVNNDSAPAPFVIMLNQKRNTRDAIIRKLTIK
nr:D-alanyl-D-alanine carboxypeptidase [Desulfobulbaceae bacterium]